MNPTTITIEGMHCGACVRRVDRALSQVPGVKVNEVSVGKATLELDGATAAEAVAAIEQAGYRANLS
jgi:copper chaperone